MKLHTKDHSNTLYWSYRPKSKRFGKNKILDLQKVLDLHEFWARNKFVQAKFVLVKLCTSMFSNIRASEIRTSKIRASQGPSVHEM